MGLAGALYVTFIGFVSPFDFLPILTFQIWAMVIVGGSGNNRGHGGVVVGNGDPAVSQQSTEMERMCPRHN